MRSVVPALDVEGGGSRSDDEGGDGERLLGEVGAAAEAVSVDAFLEAAGGFGRRQRELMCVLGVAYAGMAAQVSLPIFLRPALEGSTAGGAVGAAEVAIGGGAVGVPPPAWASDAGAPLLAMLSSIFWVGFTPGLFFWGALADRRGRRYALLASLCAMDGAALLPLLGPAVRTLLLLRCAAGFAAAGVLGGVFVLATELVGPPHRAAVKGITAVCWTAGLCYFVGATAAAAAAAAAANDLLVLSHSSTDSQRNPNSFPSHFSNELLLSTRWRARTP